MSPEGATYAIEAYLIALQKQAAVAEAFHHGKMREGIEGLLDLPKDIRLKIDQLIWDKTGGQSIDPADADASKLIAGAVLFSLEERMGMHA